jgi:hypothetical protein
VTIHRLMAGGPDFDLLARPTRWVPHPFALCAKGWEPGMFAPAFDHAAGAENEIFPQPSFTRAGPRSSMK